jgi:hypothetical protein
MKRRQSSRAPLLRLATRSSSSRPIRPSAQNAVGPAYRRGFALGSRRPRLLNAGIANFTRVSQKSGGWMPSSMSCLGIRGRVAAAVTTREKGGK